MGGEKVMEKILLAHGSGGKLTHSLIREIFLEEFRNEILESLQDSAVVDMEEGRLAYTTDSYVVDPIFFPGGDIGKLSVCGTLNDLAMSGATPLYLGVSFVIEEGFPLSSLLRIVKSMKEEANSAGIKIACGDTKVVEMGSADKIFITTTGIGIIPDGVELSPSKIKAGDQVILSGTIGEHGIAILGKRGGLEFSSEIQSDVAPLNILVHDILGKGENKIHALRDPTRGGVATTLNELSQSANLGIKVYEEKIPVRAEVRGACELLGLDPLYVANEGKLVAVVDKECAEEVLNCMRRNEYGREAEIIGEVVEGKGVLLITKIGGTRPLDMLTGEQLPRIC
jgi:hydrogenase expression/formation protein HypE